MRTYATIRGTFWMRGSGKKLRGDAEAQVLAFYLMTCQQGTACGIFYANLPAIAFETGLNLDRLPAIFSRISEIAQYDFEQDLVWVPHAAREQIGETLKPGDKRRVKFLRELEQFGNHEFVFQFYELYGPMYNFDIPVHLVRGIEGASKSSRESNMGHLLSLQAPSTAQHSTEQVKLSSEQHSTDARGSRRRHSKPLPDSWEPNENHRAKALGKLIDVDVAAEKFRNHALANDRRLVDWDRAFSNWLINERPAKSDSFDPFKFAADEARREQEAAQ